KRFVQQKDSWSGDHRPHDQKHPDLPVGQGADFSILHPRNVQQLKPGSGTHFLGLRRFIKQANTSVEPRNNHIQASLPGCVHGLQVWSNETYTFSNFPKTLRIITSESAYLST